MIRVKIITTTYGKALELEDKINKTIEELADNSNCNNIVDIKYSTSIDENNQDSHSAMIIYRK